MKDYYRVLGIPRHADEQQIRRAFRQLARRYHPDVNPKDKRAAEKFHEINEAYQTLVDATKRARYDRQYAERFQRPVTVPKRKPTVNSAPAPPAESQAPIYSTQAKPTDIFAGATLLILVFACAFMFGAFYVIVSYLAPDSTRIIEVPTLTSIEQRTQMAILNQTATAYYRPTTTPVQFLQSDLVATDELFLLQAGLGDFRGSSCMINLANNRETCGQLPQIRTYYGPSENRVALRIDLDPRRYENTRVIFIVTYAERTPRNLSVHLGDSQYNSGEGGDSRNQPFNAELIIDDYQLTVFGDRDMRRENVQVLGEYPDFISAGSIVVFEISDQQVRWVNETEGEQITSPKLYALGGQNKGDYQIFAAFNRGIALGGARDGSGVERVEIWLFPPRP